jgi:hypothetical protein
MFTTTVLPQQQTLFVKMIQLHRAFPIAHSYLRFSASAPNSPAKSSELHQTSRFMTFKQPTAGSHSRSLIRPNQAVDRAAEYMFINLFKKVLWHVGD